MVEYSVLSLLQSEHWSEHVSKVFDDVRIPIENRLKSGAQFITGSDMRARQLPLDSLLDASCSDRPSSMGEFGTSFRVA